MAKRRQKTEDTKVSGFFMKGKRKRGRFGQDGKSSALFKMAKRRRNAKDREVSTLLKKAKRRRKSCSKQDGKCSNEDRPVDRISMLPDELLVSILSRLSTKEAMAASIVSRRWRYLWTFTTGLDFNSVESLVRLAGRENGASALDRERLNYVRWVDHVIASRKDFTVEDFKVYFNLSKTSEGCIDEWVRYALSRKVQTLELNLTNVPLSSIRRDEECYVFPYRFLHANKESFSNSIHFKQLKKVLLNYVHVDGETLEFFLHNCPLLGDLSVSHSTKLSTLMVTGPFPSLKRLEISFCNNLNSLVIRDVNLVYLKYRGRRKYFLLENVPMLVNLSVDEFQFNNLEEALVQFSSILPQLEILNLCISHKCYRKDMFYLPVKMSNLKQLVVTYSLGQDESLLPLTNLIRAAPRLQKSVLETHRYMPKSKFCEELQTMKIKKLYPHLKEVEFVGYRGMPSDLELVVHFVENAAALKKVIIDPWVHCKTPYEHKLRYDSNSTHFDIYIRELIKSRARAKKQLVQKVPWRIKLEIL